MPARGQWHGMDHKSIPVWVQKINDSDHPAPGSTTDYELLLAVALTGKAPSGVSHNQFNLPNRAPVLGRVFAIPLDPPELGRCHHLTI